MIDPKNIYWNATTLIRTKYKGKYIKDGYATGFFIEDDDEIFLVTNKHVVSPPGPDEANKIDTIELKLHKSEDNWVHNSVLIDIKLSDENNNKTWIEHKDSSVDIVIFKTKEIEEPSYVSPFPLTMIPSRDFFLPPGDDLVVFGYPHETYDDVNNIPIARSASLASPYHILFRNSKCCIIDSFLHTGCSGSPVLRKPNPRPMVTKDGQGITYHIDGRYYLLGVFSEEEPTREELNKKHDEGECHLGLNKVWFSWLIPEIIKDGI